MWAPDLEVMPVKLGAKTECRYYFTDGHLRPSRKQREEFTSFHMPGCIHIRDFSMLWKVHHVEALLKGISKAMHVAHRVTGSPEPVVITFLIALKAQSA